MEETVKIIPVRDNDGNDYRQKCMDSYILKIESLEDLLVEEKWGMKEKKYQEQYTDFQLKLN